MWSTSTVTCLRDSGVTEVEIDRAQYWTVDLDEQRWNPEGVSSPILGNVAGDVHDLRAAMAREAPDRIVTLWHEIMHLRGVLGQFQAHHLDGALAGAARAQDQDEYMAEGGAG
ncbi:MAG: hypothetical protein KTR21_15065 [Rhodobacteraceae bacterium]|nr:hypothetical protein [Paracoccaceae bacterium]